MKTLISVLVAALVLVSMTYAQNPQGDNKFTPRTLSAGTSMSARTYGASYDDTTQTFRVGGFARVFVHVLTAANDSASVLLSYSVSNDGQTWGAYTLFDSLSTTGTVGANKAFELPAGAMGGEYVRIRQYYSPINRVSASPATTVTTIIRRKPY
jgi:hypothetical protein